MWQYQWEIKAVFLPNNSLPSYVTINICGNRYIKVLLYMYNGLYLKEFYFQRALLVPQKQK